jgi:hypothetical protein
MHSERHEIYLETSDDPEKHLGTKHIWGVTLRAMAIGTMESSSNTTGKNAIINEWGGNILKPEGVMCTD